MISAVALPGNDAYVWGIKVTVVVWIYIYIYIYIYVCIVITLVWSNQLGKVVNPARG